MSRPLGTLALAGALALAACAPDAPLAPSALARAPLAAATATATDGGARHLGFYSRNLYIGTNFDPVVGALASPSPADDIPALLTAVANIRATDWASRVVAVADEVARERPAVIGLQEAWNVDVDLRPLGLAVTLDLDFLGSLQDELAGRGLHYVVAATWQGVTAAPLPGINVVDRDVILVDPARVTVHPGSVVAQGFAANLGAVAPGVLIQRGWVALTADVDGETLRIANAHLEAGDAPGLGTLRGFQAGQLMATLAAHPRAVVMGDFNDVPGSVMYQQVMNAGFTDAWRAMRPGVEGLTCCHAEVLDNARAQDAFWMRIDYIFARGVHHTNGALLGRIALTGTTASDRLAGPSWRIWPSDHAGLALQLLLPAND